MCVLQIGHITGLSLAFGESYTLDFNDNVRIDCHPEENASQQSCESRGCTWKVGIYLASEALKMAGKTIDLPFFFPCLSTFNSFAARAIFYFAHTSTKMHIS